MWMCMAIMISKLAISQIERKPTQAYSRCPDPLPQRRLNIARWLQGDSIWRERSPGTLIHRLSTEPHAVHTGIESLLALYVWCGDIPIQKACLEPEFHPS